MKEYILSGDVYKMNWIEGNTEWGTVKCTVPLTVNVKSEKNGDILKESYVFTNNTDKDIFTKLTDIGIYTPFNDDYTTAKECMTNKCHTHIWCGDDVAYIMALRMGGGPANLGLVLTEGSIRGYSVERDLKRMSNDRGDFILHPAPFSLAPKESYTVSWTLFPHTGKNDFYKTASKYCGTFLYVESDKYVLFEGERAEVEIAVNFPFEKEDIEIMHDKENVDFTVSGNSVFLCPQADVAGEMIYRIRIGRVHTFLRLLVMPPLSGLVKSRCRFIAENQQYHKAGSHLDGAYLIYDNEEKTLFYSPQNDYNGGRERVGMGILLAKYLQCRSDESIEKSLLQYVGYVKRELVDETDGRVYNDYMRDDSYRRLYNAPWFALFYVELYRLYKKRDDLMTAYKIIMNYYENGGVDFYPIELPAVDVINCMESEHMDAEIKSLMEYFIRHADCICKTGICYPGSEVNYEQSIVAPAADILLKVYALTKNRKYLEAAEEQLKILELFNGIQPDYHLHETAIRHWDGYWFGKRRMYGDTFPHYWSALTGLVYRRYAEITGSTEYYEKAENSIRGTLSLFHPDGTASCAYVYPERVNGENAAFADPYANDQDWGMYFALKLLESKR